MKNVKLIITSIVLMLTVTTASASNFITTKKDVNSKKELRTKIIALLGKQVPIKIDTKEKMAAKISFMLNNKNEVIVISVGSENTAIDSYVKEKLNYKVVKVDGIKKGEIYQMPLKIKKS